jgi:hypothetical protein
MSRSVSWRILAGLIIQHVLTSATPSKLCTVLRTVQQETRHLLRTLLQDGYGTVLAVQYIHLRTYRTSIHPSIPHRLPKTRQLLRRTAEGSLIHFMRFSVSIIFDLCVS